MMKKYRVTFYKDRIYHIAVITATNRREALQKAWSMFGEDFLYLEELKDETD